MVAAVPLGGAGAAMVQYNTFDADGTATVGADATIDSAASISATSQVGAGALLLPGTPDLTSSAVLTGYKGILGTAARTVTFFMKANGAQDTTGGAMAMWGGYGSSPNGTRFEIRTENATIGKNAVRIEVQGGYKTAATDIVTDGLWHHVALVMDAGDGVWDVDIYIDGVLDGTAGKSSTNRLIDTVENSDVLIGRSAQDTLRNFNGLIDDFRIYDTALTAPEVAELAALPEPGSLALLGVCSLLVASRRRRLILRKARKN